MSHGHLNYLQSQFRRLAFAKARGSKKALIAVGHSILIAIWHRLTHGNSQ
jgi:hypothetical protein